MEFLPDELNSLLAFIKTFNGIYTYPLRVSTRDQEEQQARLHQACKLLAKRGLVRMERLDPGCYFWQPVTETKPT